MRGFVFKTNLPKTATLKVSQWFIPCPAPLASVSALEVEDLGPPDVTEAWEIRS